MRFHRAIAAAVFLSAIIASAGARAFETTSIGGTNADGSAKYQDPDETGGIPTPSSSSPLGNLNLQVGTDNDTNSSTNWLNGPGSSGFGFTGSQSSSSTEPATPFNTPLLRDRN
ncbi:MAG TPA: hypothetical protein VIF39_01835 [Hyphomicrobium sp.]|jgi:hypothetical protein